MFLVGHFDGAVMKKNFVSHACRGLRQRGFSFPELMVSIAIFTILSLILLSDYKSFGTRLSLESMVEEMGQWVRETQITAMSVKPSAANSAVFPGYGLHFVSGSNQFLYFTDLDNSKTYNAGDGLEKTITLSGGNTVFSLCGTTAGPAVVAPCVNPLGKANAMDIVFRRPDPDANIWGDKNGAGPAVSYSSVIITVSSPRGYLRSVEVRTTGQITIQ